MLYAATKPDIWRFQAHPEVWVLVAAVVGSYWYAITRIGPQAVKPGDTIVTRKQLWWFAAAVAVLWGASDWPIHDIAEKYLYSVHMTQHMMLSYFMPPMVLLATPEWLARAVIGQARFERVFRFLVKPVVAGVMFNVTIMVTHIPGIVNRSAGTPVLHYSLHVILVTTALLMWMCVLGPIPEYRIGTSPQMIYLFAQSVIPTVPAGWLTFADGIVYSHYNHAYELFGLDPTQDQQLAGAIMKIGGSMFLWVYVAVIFFKHLASNWERDQAESRYRHIPDAEIVGVDDGPALTYDAVQTAFSRTPAPVSDAER